MILNVLGTPNVSAVPGHKNLKLIQQMDDFDEITSQSSKDYLVSVEAIPYTGHS